MAQVILLCGRICSGKTTYAAKLREDMNAAVLSCDELMLTLFPDGAGEYHDKIAERARKYQFDLALQLAQRGMNVILDWGFWTQSWRDEARAFFVAHGVSCQLHYVDALPETWRQHIRERNQAVREGRTQAYYVDDGLLRKLASRFEEPGEDEIDLRYVPQ